jgi:hypothetical protein
MNCWCQLYLLQVALRQMYYVRCDLRLVNLTTCEIADRMNNPLATTLKLITCQSIGQSV